MEEANMHLQHAWERTLLDLAHEALHSDAPAVSATFAPGASGAGVPAVRSDHRRSQPFVSPGFAVAARPEAPRRVALMRFAASATTSSTRAQGDAQERGALAAARHVAHPPVDDLVAIAWADARLRFNVPLRYAEQSIDGVARDFQPVRYDTFEELAAYCYGALSTVGLMSMHIIGFAGQEAIPYAIKLGVALQMTNILRDVGEGSGVRMRLYLPRRVQRITLR